MSLLLVAIVQDRDADRLVEALTAAGHRSTRIPSVGGFLKAGNTTVLVGAEESAEADLLAIFEQTCSGREVDVPLVLLDRLNDAPRVVQYGGATIFVVELRATIRL